MTQSDDMFADGRAYEHLMGRWSRLTAQSFLPWIDVPADLDWLDVGCGNGAFTEEIIALCSPKAITGLDASDEQIAYARSRVEGKLATYLKGDAQSLPLGDNSFDAAVMALVIAFLPEPARAVADMVRVTKSGGYVATYMWDLPGGGSPVEPIYVAMRSMGMPERRLPSLDASTIAGLSTIWHKAGLADIQSKTFQISLVFPDFEAFWTAQSVPVGPQGKFIEALSPDMREALKSRVLELTSINMDGTIAYSAFANAIVGRVP